MLSTCIKNVHWYTRKLAITKYLGFVHVFSKGFGGYKSGDQRYFEAVNRRKQHNGLGVKDLQEKVLK